jgi:error-prone DNA polymerase
MYVELRTHSHFSLLQAASSPRALVERAAALGYTALALTDRDNVYGAVEFWEAAREHGIRPLHGAELTLHSGHRLTLLVESAVGWANLCQLITQAQRNAPKGAAQLPKGALAAHREGLIALYGGHGDDWPGGEQHLRALRGLFGRECLFVALVNHLRAHDRRRVAWLCALAERYGLACVATNDVAYATRDGQPLHDVMTAIRHNVPLDNLYEGLDPNDERHLKPPAEMAALFADYPEALAAAARLAERCTFRLDEIAYELPAFRTPDGSPACAYLRALCEGSPRFLPTMQDTLERELAIIERVSLCGYFLIVWDIVRFARSQSIRCQGRGSAANSLTAYLLYITSVNPLAHDLVFERFLSEERRATPDIDVDFDNSRREEVIQYIYATYGRDHAAMACTYSTYRSRSAVRDIGKALGLAPAMISHLVDSLRDESAHHPPLQRQIITLGQAIRRRPRHLGIHNGGMVVSGRPLHEIVPVEPAAMDGRTVTQWDKEGLESLSIPKIDILGLGMLAMLEEASVLAGVDIDELTFDDPAVYDMIDNADTTGVFQVESRAQMTVLPRMRPRSFQDLMISISLIRPGPLQGGMVHPYLRRRLGEEPITHFHPLLKPILHETLGVVLFQEQVLKVARALAGFTAGEGELLRRALGRKNAPEAVAAFEARFIAGAAANGVDVQVAADVFDRLRAFGAYSFPKSHAAAFAVLVYQSAWLRLYHPRAFYVALLNNQPMGFYSPATIIYDAMRRGLAVHPVDLHRSGARCTVCEDGLRLGLNYIRGLGQAAIEAIIAGRPYGSLHDFCRRLRLPERLVENLIMAGAMDAWGGRRDLIWQLGAIHYEPALDLALEAIVADLPALTDDEAREHEVYASGVITGDHPMVAHREVLDAHGVLSKAGLDEAADGAQVIVAGLMIVRQQPPTAKGFQFLTLEDEFGYINVIMRPKIRAQFRPVVEHNPILLVGGRLQIERGVRNVIAERVRGLLG